MLGGTVWQTFQLDRARLDRDLLFKDLTVQSLKIQADMSGLWETLPSGLLQGELPNETDPSVRKYLMDSAQRDESMRQLLFVIRARFEEHESGS